MKLFKPLTDSNYLQDFLRHPKGKNSVCNISAMLKKKRYEKKYFLNDDNQEPPKKILNLIGYIKNNIKSAGSNYKHGNYEIVFIKKTPFYEGPRITKNVNDDDKAFYREVVLLNRADLLMHSVIASKLRDYMRKNSEFSPMRSQKQNVEKTLEFLKHSLHDQRCYYLKTDIKNFIGSIDLIKVRQSLFDNFDNDLDLEDKSLLENIHNSYNNKILKTRCSGSPIDQLLCEWGLHCLDEELEKHFDEYYIRFGEDILCRFPDKELCKDANKKIQDIVKNTLGSKCKLHEIEENDFCPATKWLVPDNEGKAIIDCFTEHGVEFCGYYYSLKESEIAVRIRYNTMEKLSDRIREYTGLPIVKDLPQKHFDEKKIRLTINKLNNLFGFYRNKTNGKLEFSENFGVISLFRLPDGVDRSFVNMQAERLNHYMLRRLRHVHRRNIRNELRYSYDCDYDSIKSYREEVDKGYRELGLNTIMDGLNRLGP